VEPAPRATAPPQPPKATWILWGWGMGGKSAHLARERLANSQHNRYSWAARDESALSPAEAAG
jgi:hypothetical protein